jgi:hypothetical protein
MSSHGCCACPLCWRRRGPLLAASWSPALVQQRVLWLALPEPQPTPDAAHAHPTSPPPTPFPQQGEEADDDSDGVLEVEDDQYLKKLQRAARDILGGGDGDDEDDDGEDDWSDEEEACSTPLEEIEPYSHLVEALAAMQAAMPARYATVVGGADAAMQASLQALQAHAESERQRRQAEATSAV